MSKYSSFKEHQLITENWREFLTEERPDDNEVAKLASLVVSGADGGAQARELLLSLDIGNEVARQYTAEQVILRALQRSDEVLAAAPPWRWPDHPDAFGSDGLPARLSPWDTYKEPEVFQQSQDARQEWLYVLAGLDTFVDSQYPGPALAVSADLRARAAQGGRHESSIQKWEFVRQAEAWRDNPEEALQGWLSAWRKSQGS